MVVPDSKLARGLHSCWAEPGMVPGAKGVATDSLTIGSVPSAHGARTDRGNAGRTERTD